MKLSRNVGTFLLAIWLILKGLMPLLGLSFKGSGTVMAILAVAAGIMLILDR